MFVSTGAPGRLPLVSAGVAVRLDERRIELERAPQQAVHARGEGRLLHLEGRRGDPGDERTLAR